MDLNTSKEDLSDEEVLFGKLKLKEFKKHIHYIRGESRPFKSCLPVGKEQNHDKSLISIETHSDPGTSGVIKINSTDLKSISDSSDDSIIRLEEMDTELCISPKQDTDVSLDNTLDMVNFILNRGRLPPKDKLIDDDNKSKSEDKKICLPVGKEQNHDKSLISIETHSDPGTSGVIKINSTDLKSISDSSDDSIIRLEEMDTELCISPKQDTDVSLDNTLDMVNFILNRGRLPPKDKLIDDDNKSKSEDKKICLPVRKKHSHDKSLISIETHSDPGTSGVIKINSTDLKSISDSSDNSIIRLEEMDTELCISPKQDTDVSLDNTLDMVNFILNRGRLPPKDKLIDDDNKSKSEDKKICLPVRKKQSHDKSLISIETHSDPGTSGVIKINSPNLKSISDSSDDSIIRLEEMDTELCISPKQDTDVSLDNSLDMVNFILNCGRLPPKDKLIDDDNKSKSEDKKICLPVRKKQSHDKSLISIETHSDPGTSGVIKINSPNLKSISDSLDDSFIRLEEMDTELCISPKQDTDESLDNTLDMVNFIINRGTLPPKDKFIDDDNQSKSEDKKICLIRSATSPGMTEKEYAADIRENKDGSERKHDLFIMKDENTGLNSKVQKVESKTPIDKSIKSPNRMELNNKHLFKTPVNVLSCKKQTPNLKKTPGKSSAYQHISSPIAAYIRNSPQIPLFQAVHPKKPLPGVSLMPKLAESTENKENKGDFQLPSIAYMNAKKTKLVSADKQKLPQGQRIKKFVSSNPKPVVIKHNHRQEITSTKRSDSTEDNSFGNLTLHQADLSICTQKSAFSNK